MKNVKLTFDLDNPSMKPSRDGYGDGLNDAAAKNPGSLPVLLALRYPDGRVVDVDMGTALRVAGTMAFFSELSKAVPQSATSFSPSDKIYLAPREARPWEQ